MAKRPYQRVTEKERLQLWERWHRGEPARPTGALDPRSWRWRCSSPSRAQRDRTELMAYGASGSTYGVAGFLARGKDLGTAVAWRGTSDAFRRADEAVDDADEAVDDANEVLKGLR